MKKFSMKVGAWILVLAMICTMLPMAAFAAGESVVFEADTSAYTAGVKPGDTVNIPIKVTTNNGFAGASLKITYSDSLTLTGVTAGDMGFSESRSGDNYTVYTTSNVTSTGILATLNFTVNSDAAAGEASVGVVGRYNDGTDVSDASQQNVSFAVVPATLTINESGTVVDPNADYTASVTTSTSTVNNDGTASNVTVNVDVGGNSSSFNSAEIKLSYDANYLTFANGSAAQTMAEGDQDVTITGANGVITIRDYGTAFETGKTAYTLTFTTVKGGNTNVGLTSAGFSTQTDAETEDLTYVTSTNTVAITINHKVTISDGTTTTTDYVTPNAAYEYSIPGYNANNNYEVTVKMDGSDISNTAYADGKVNISSVTGAVEISYTVTPKNYNITWSDSESVITNKSHEASVPYGTNVTFDVPANQDASTIDGWTYNVKVTLDDDDDDDTNNTVIETTSAAATSGDGLTYTIDGTKITGDITVTVTKEVVPANSVIVTVNGDSGLTLQDSEGNTLTSPATVAKGSDVVLVLTPEAGYSYEVKVGDQVVTLTDNKYTIENIEESVTVTVTKTLDTTSLTVSQYVQLDGKTMWLVKIGSAQISNKTYTYTAAEGEAAQNFFWSSQYGTYCFLLITDTNTDADTVKGNIADKLGLTDTAATAISYNGNVNLTKDADNADVIDVNDAQLVWNMYSAVYSAFTENVTVQKFLEADMDNSGTLTTADAAAVVGKIN